MEWISYSRKAQHPASVQEVINVAIKVIRIASDLVIGAVSLVVLTGFIWMVLS